MTRTHPSASLRATTTVFRAHNDRLAAHLAGARQAAGPSPVDVLDEYLAGAPAAVRAAWRALRATVRP